MKTTHTASSGQPSGSQLKTVQYPPGCVVSQSRSPFGEQSVESEHLSPILGAQAAAPRSAKGSARARQKAAVQRRSLLKPRDRGWRLPFTGRHPTLASADPQGEAPRLRTGQPSPFAEGGRATELRGPNVDLRSSQPRSECHS